MNRPRYSATAYLVILAIFIALLLLGFVWTAAGVAIVFLIAMVVIG